MSSACCGIGLRVVNVAFWMSYHSVRHGNPEGVVCTLPSLFHSLGAASPGKLRYNCRKRRFTVRSEQVLAQLGSAKVSCPDLPHAIFSFNS